MIKKLLFIFLFSVCTLVFSQKTLQKLTTAPNPFYNTTTISFHAKKAQLIYLTVKNLLGKTVYKKTITAKKGKNSFPFNKENLQAGMYIYTIQNRKEIVSKRFVIK